MSAVVAIARRWLGTPYVHQASIQGVGTDCLGLIRGIWRELSGIEPETVPPYSADWSEPQNEEVLAQAAFRLLDPVSQSHDLKSGQILLFRMRDCSVAKHLGILTGIGPSASFIHAYQGHGVVESSLATPWARRIVARFDYPDSLTGKGR